MHIKPLPVDATFPVPQKYNQSIHRNPKLSVRSFLLVHLPQTFKDVLPSVSSQFHVAPRRVQTWSCGCRHFSAINHPSEESVLFTIIVKVYITVRIWLFVVAQYKRCCFSFWEEKPVSRRHSLFSV